MSVADPRWLDDTIPSDEGLYPLPITALEAYLLADARPGYTMMCDLECHFTGRLDRAAFEFGLTYAVARAPLFRSRIELRKGQPWAWIGSAQRPRVEWSANPPAAWWYDQPLDLTQEIGLRVWVQAGDSESRVLLHFHHACSDAIGGCGFFEDLLAGYAAAIGTTPVVAPRPLDPTRLLRRGDPGTAGRPLLQRVLDQFIGSWEGYKFFFDNPLPLAASPSRSAGPAPLLPPDPLDPTPAAHYYQSRTISKEIMGGLKRAATRAEATVNDVLLRDMFLTLRGWNAEAGEAPPHRRLRILMPQNLRTSADEAMSAANLIAFALPSRRVSACEQPERLLHSLLPETRAIREQQTSRYTTGNLASLCAMGALHLALRSDLCFATVILTNVGNTLRRFVTKFPTSEKGLVVGDVVFTGITGVPCLRPLTRAAICIFSSDRELTFCIKADPARIAPEDSQRLLNGYVQQLVRTAEAA